MSARVRGLLRGVATAVVVVVLVGTVVVAQRTVDLTHLALQLAAITGLLGALWLYNRGQR